MLSEVTPAPQQLNREASPWTFYIRCRFNEATDCAFPPESGNTMTADEYGKLPAVERERFMECPECREILSLEEVLLHLAYKHSGFRL
jgi:hypothetical protein